MPVKIKAVRVNGETVSWQKSFARFEMIEIELNLPSSLHLTAPDKTGDLGVIEYHNAYDADERGYMVFVEGAFSHGSEKEPLLVPGFAARDPGPELTGKEIERKG